MKYFYLTLIVFSLIQVNGIQAQNLENINEVAKRKFLDIKGSLSLTSNYFISSREFNQQNPFRYVISGNPVLSIYGFDLPLSFTFANSEFSATGPSNFQRVGASPYYKWIKIHAGYRNIAFNPYTLNNHNFLGAGVELNPGNLRVGFVYGRFVNAIAEDTTSSQVLPPSYRRMGYSFKIGYGSENNFFDISVLKAKDDPTSIPDPVQSEITPAENLAIGISTRLTFFKSIIWEFDGGVSAYTEDLLAGSIESIDQQIPPFVYDFFQPLASTRVNFAGNTSLTLQLTGFSLSAEYMRVDPEYETMGSYFFNNDLERYTIAPTIRLWKGKVNLSGSVGLQRDNLLNNKAATTERTIGSANLQLTPFPRFSLNAQYSNYATEQQSGLINLNDTVRIFQVNHNINVTPTYVITGDRFYHNFVLSVGSQMLVDKNIFTENFTESQTNNANFNYRLQNNRIDYGITTGLNYITLTSGQANITRYGLSLGFNKGFFDQKLNLRLNGMYNLSESENVSDGYVMNGSFDVQYNPSQFHSFAIRSQAILNRTTAEFQDYILSANYTLSF